MEHGGATKAERLEQVKAMLASRLDFKGNPLPGYATNVVMAKSEIARLEAEIAKGEK
jgi:hypothetical protein